MSFTGGRGHQGKALIIAGIIILAAGVALAVGFSEWESSHGDNFWANFIPIFVCFLGVRTIGKGVRQARRARNSIGGPGQWIPPPGHGSQPPGGQPAPDWYPDPWDPSQLRWWDGHAWTQHTQARP